MMDSAQLEFETAEMSAAETVVMVSPLATASSPELRRLTVLETEETVILCGHVSSFYMKQMAQETVRDRANGRYIVNRIVVKNCK